MNRAEAERIFCNLYIFGLYGAIYLKWKSYTFTNAVIIIIIIIIIIRREND